MAPKKKDAKASKSASASIAAAAPSASTPKDPNTVTLSSTNLPLWLTEGSSQRDKNVLCESIYIYTPDGKKELIKNARVQFVYGRRYGLIGPNGAGKSTLLKHVYAYDLPNFPKYLRVIYVQQHDMVDVQDEVLDWVVNSDEEKKWLESEEQRLLTDLEENEDADADEIQDKLDIVTDRLAVMDARRANTRAAAILTGLGFTTAMLKAPISSLSGGWKQRVALACALFVSSDLLLLDEPTNHLDFGAVRWLEQFVKSLTQTVVIVSHDRNFLNQVSTDIIELVDTRLDYYRGDYTAYVKTRDEHYRQRRHDYEVQQKKVTELKQFIEEAKKSDNPATVNLQKTRQKQLEKMELIPEPTQEKDFKFTFPDPGKLDHALLEINSMSFAYGGTKESKGRDWLIRDVNLHMDQDSRIGVLGVNGAGKSTLIKLIKGELTPQEGVCRLNPHCRVANFTQHQIDQLDLTKSTMDYLQFLFPAAKEHQIRGAMGRFGFDAKLIAQKIGELSGGQRSRVAFAILTWREPHLIIMDEPTNHLDLQTIEALIHALSNFKGGVLLVSHDQYFLQSVAKEYWAFNREGDVQVFYDLDEAKPFSYELIDYEGGTTNREALIKQAQQAAIAEKAKKTGDGEAGETAATNAQRGKKKRKTKRGGGGVDMAELKINEALDAIKFEEERKQTEIVDITFEDRKHTDNEEDEEGEEDVHGETEVVDEAGEEQPMEDEAEEQEPEPVEKKKKKKDKKSRALEDEEELVEESVESAPIKEKKKKKKKSADDDAAEAVEATEPAEDFGKEKKKKKKKDADDALAEQLESLSLQKKKSKKSVDADALSDEPVKEKRKKKSKLTFVDEEDEPEAKAEKPKKKDKKKKKHTVDDDDNDDDEAEAEPVEKKKKSRDADVDEPVAEPVKGKKSKDRKKQQDEDEQPAEEADDQPVKKKDKKKSKATAAVDEDANVPVEDEAPKKKKKSKARKGAEDDDADAPIDDDSRERKKKKKKSVDDEDDEAPVESGKSKKSKSKAANEDEDDVAAEPKKDKKKKKNSAVDDDMADDEQSIAKKDKKKKSKTAVNEDEDGEQPKKKEKTSKKSRDDDEEEQDEPLPAKSKKKDKKKQTLDDEADDPQQDDKPKKSTKKAAVAANDDADEQPKKKEKKKSKSKASDDD